MTEFTEVLRSSIAAPAVLIGVVAALLVVIPGAGWLRQAAGEEANVALPAPAMDAPAPAVKGPQTAVLAGGCFWGIQGVFEHVRGVQRVLSGYSGGDANTAHYERVGSGMTGHAESVEIVFDPSVVSYGQILRVFFSVAHDPTELNRQGPDEGTQYRSSVFYADATQKKVAEAYIAQLNQAHVFRKPIATRVDPLKAFYPAEGYHQDYLIHNPDQPYIVYNDLPKIENLKRVFPDKYVDAPVMVADAQKR